MARQTSHRRQSPVPADISARAAGTAPFRQGRPGRFRRPADTGQPARHGLRSLQGAVRLAVGRAEKPYRPRRRLNGVSPGYWKGHTGWPSPCTTSTKFNSVFYCAGLNKNTYGAATTTFGLILNHQDFDSCNLGMHMAATYLNIKSGRIGFLTVTALQKIWYDWQRYGYYSPTAGVQWDATRIVTYLTGTMD